MVLHNIYDAGTFLLLIPQRETPMTKLLVKEKEGSI